MPGNLGIIDRPRDSISKSFGKSTSNILAICTLVLATAGTMVNNIFPGAASGIKGI